MHKFLHSFLSFAAVAFTALAPALQSTISHHPLVTAVLGGIWAVIGHLLPSPLAATK